MDESPTTLGQDAIDALVRHHWPGNVRELEQSIAAAVALSDSRVIAAGSLGRTVDNTLADESIDVAALLDLPLTEAKTRLVEDFERRAISQALETSSGNISAAARALGIHRQSLQQKITQLGLPRSSQP